MSFIHNIDDLKIANLLKIVMIPDELSSVKSYKYRKQLESIVSCRKGWTPNWNRMHTRSENYM